MEIEGLRRDEFGEMGREMKMIFRNWDWIIVAADSFSLV